jgi:hypothetical protein
MIFGVSLWIFTRFLLLSEMPTPAAKRRIAAATGAIMCNPGLLDATFSYLVGQGLFVAAVCKQWQQSYARATVNISKDPNVTLHRAAFESASRILVAVHSYNLDLDKMKSST